jgi:hypothetical protein
MTAISCPFPSRRCETSASSLKEPSAFNPSGTFFWPSLQCLSATRTTHFVYVTCYLCLGHVCYLCLGLGPSRKVQRFARASRRTPKRQMYYAFEAAEPRLCAGPRLGGSVGLGTYSAIRMPIISRKRFGFPGASPHQSWALLSCFTPMLYPGLACAADNLRARIEN